MTDAEFNEETDVVYPADQDPVARYNVVLDSAIRGEDGYWEVVRTIKQVVTFDNETWFVREKSVKSIDKEFSNANRTTHSSINSLLTEYEDDFFSKGTWDGNQYIMTTKDKDQVLVEEHHGIVESV
jgi:hypothetical protein